MQPTTLAQLKLEADIAFSPNGLSMMVNSSWVVLGEDRLSYTTIVQLVECCREYHWQKDVLINVNSGMIDSITKSISCSFLKPIMIGETILIRYRLVNIKEKGYEIEFILSDDKQSHISAIINMVSIFYDPKLQSVSQPPKAIIDRLKRIKHNDNKYF